MSFKIFISTRLLLSILVAQLFISSCGSPGIDPDENAAREDRGNEPSGQSAGDTQEEDDGIAPITDSNSEDFFLQYARKHPENSAVIKTDFGDITIELYANTPVHRANFLYLTRQDYFDGTWFYRVSKGHVIQAGNNDDPETLQKRKRLGDYTLPNEISAGNLHRRGAVAAARSYYQNPEKRSDPFEFYICLGQSYTYNQLKAMEEEYGIKLSEAQMKVYASEGGAPHLDEEHTVFGRVVSGMDVVEKIAEVKVDEGEWPLNNIPITVRVID